MSCSKLHQLQPLRRGSETSNVYYSHLNLDLEEPKEELFHDRSENMRKGKS